MVLYREEYATDRLYFDDTPFANLMRNRVIEVLLVCSNYERFALEEDGCLEEQLFQEYVAAGLHYPPRFSFAPTPEVALSMIEGKWFDLVIAVAAANGIRAVEFAGEIRRLYPNKPVVILTRYAGDLVGEAEARSAGIRYIFNWLGNGNILLAIVKLVEDAMNVEHDVDQAGVQTIILVENSVRYYSTYLPVIYGVLFEQTRALIKEGLNEHEKTLRMRGRPKILLATDFEEAVALYERYRDNVLGVISDISFERQGKIDRLAGLELCRHIRGRDPELPILLQSSRPQHAEGARACSAGFIDKESTTLIKDLATFIKESFGFGDFVFVMPHTYEEVGRARGLNDLQHKLKVVPAESLQYHASSHHISKWLKARALYALASVIEPKKLEDFDGVESLRAYLVDTIKNYRLHMARGVIATFDKDKFDDSLVLQRIGSGSLGGKGRGIAFVNTFLKRNRIMFRFRDVVVQIPKSVVLATDVFRRFMADNDLQEIALSDRSDEELLQRFLRGKLPEEVMGDLVALVKVIHRPLAVRSSSGLEDSTLHPFAGVYSTYFVPNSSPGLKVRVRGLSDAIKAVYASTYFQDSKSYASSTHNRVDDEEMAVVIQEVTGNAYGGAYYPSISGVARSLNFYPFEGERREEGVVNLALGLGKTVVDGRASLRFSAAWPERILQLSDVDLALKSTQKKFYAIDLAPDSFRVTTDESANLLHLDVSAAEPYPANRQLLSTYDFRDHVVRDDPGLPGQKLVTFAPVLSGGSFPLAEIVQTLLELGAGELNMPVEIEFAVDLDVPAGSPRVFKFLQIRPVVEACELGGRIDDVPRDETIITAATALGNGVYEGLCDLVYVRQGIDGRCTSEVVAVIDRINRRLRSEQRHYILVGPGRWGSSDPWLGIPIKWVNITNARVIVEASTAALRADGSQGSHFFQNITAFRVAYLTIDPAAGDGTFDVGYLDARPALHEDRFVRHLRFEQPVVVKIDGRHNGGRVKAVVLKPGSTTAAECTGAHSSRA